jgi:hypothetical protein
VSLLGGSSKVDIVAYDSYVVLKSIKVEIVDIIISISNTLLQNNSNFETYTALLMQDN